MARVFVSAFSNISWVETKYHDSFVQGFLNCLKRSGNEILMSRDNDFVSSAITQDVSSRLDSDKLLSYIKDFDPELIITFNNSFPHHDILEFTNCPVLVYPSDSPAFFANKDLVKKHRDRYYFCHLSNQITTAVKNTFPFITNNAFVEFGYATDFRSVEMEQNMNISFVGSIGNYSGGLPNYFISPEMKNYKSKGSSDEWDIKNDIKNKFFAEFDKFKDDPMGKFNFDFPNSSGISEVVEATMILVLTCKKRFEILSNLTDLGLAIFGYPKSWSQTITYNYDLFRCFDYRLTASIEQVSERYNSSKISLNLPNAQAIEGFSWRVCDILASNSVLLSPQKIDLEKLTKGYVKLPTYETKEEARELSQKLLKDDVWRKEIVLASNAMIRDRCRFEDRLKSIESSIGGFSLFAEKTGVITDLDSSQFLTWIKKVENAICKKDIKSDLKKSRYSFLLMLSYLPFFNRIINGERYLRKVTGPLKNT